MQKTHHCRNSYKIQSKNHEKEATSIPLTHKYMTAHLELLALLTALVGVGIQLAGEKQLHDHIISLRREVCAHQTDLTLPHFIKVSAPSLASERLFGSES
jgi:hypothetical protein